MVGFGEKALAEARDRKELRTKYVAIEEGFQVAIKALGVVSTVVNGSVEVR